MNSRTQLTVEESANRARARAQLELLKSGQVRTAKGAWGVVDRVRELAPIYGKMAEVAARRMFGHRPCARVGLKTKPFHVVQTRKHALCGMGRIIGGHRRIALKP